MRKQIRCTAVDDEPLALKQMEDYISRMPGLALDGAFLNGIEAMYHMQTKGTDLLFLDIQMDHINGIQLLESMRVTPLVILTTAYEKYAIKGFELDVCDYLLKPIAFERFVKACNKAITLLTGRQKIETVTTQGIPVGTEDYIFVKCDYRICRIEIDQILYIEGCRDYLKIHTPERTYITLMSFKKLEAQLPENAFFRIHKSFLVPLGKIDSIGRNTIRISTREIPVGEVYKQGFFKILAQRGIQGYDK